MSEHITKKNIVIDFMKQCSLEVTPNAAKKINSFQQILDKNSTMFVTFLSGSSFDDTLKTVKQLHNDGMRSVPHLAARAIPNKAFLEENLKILQGEYDVDEILLIGGALSQPIGDFSSSIEILRTGLFEKYGIEKVGLAGHPEGAPDFSKQKLSKAIRDKNKYAEQSPIDFYITTQFCFESEPIIKWDQYMRQEYGNKLPIHIGIPGLASIKTLIRHAQACGIGNSIRVLTKQAANITKLLNVKTPDKLVYDLAIYCAKNPECGIKQTHLYPLGSLIKSVEWLNGVQNGDFIINDKYDGFRVISKN